MSLLAFVLFSSVGPPAWTTDRQEGIECACVRAYALIRDAMRRRDAISRQMALLSTPQSSLKLPTTPLLLTIVIAWFLTGSEAFQSRYLPILWGAPFRPRLPSCKVGDGNEKEELIEAENPDADFDKQSLSGVRYGSVFDSLYALYPPTDLEKRNAVSRSDGYWPFINSGQEPPKQFTYGEYDLYFFGELLDRALDYYNEYQEIKSPTWDGKVFTDIGSGTGRLVFAAAALHPGWRLCRGVEVLVGIHNIAVETLEKCRHEVDGSSNKDNAVDTTDETEFIKNQSECDDGDDDETPVWKYPFGVAQEDDDWLDQLKQQYDDTAPDDDEDLHDESEKEEELTTLSDDEDSKQELENAENKNFDLYILPANENAEASDEMLCLAPIELTCGSFEDPYVYIGDSDLIFVFSSCMSDDMMSSLSKAFGRQCKPGTIIITTDYALPLSGHIQPLEEDESMPSGPYKLDLLESIDGWCWLTGGQSVAYVHRVVSSLWEEGVGPRQKPVIPLEEQAWRIVQAYEAGELTDTGKFLREVRNAMIFHGLPESWLPSLDDD